MFTVCMFSIFTFVVLFSGPSSSSLIDVAQEFWTLNLSCYANLDGGAVVFALFLLPMIWTQSSNISISIEKLSCSVHGFE